MAYKVKSDEGGEQVWLCDRFEDLEPGLHTLAQIDFEHAAYHDRSNSVHLRVIRLDFSAWWLCMDSWGMTFTSKEVPWESTTEPHDLVRYLTLWDSYKDTLGSGVDMCMVREAPRLAAYLLSGVA
jgi:hypothetical protein